MIFFLSCFLSGPQYRCGKSLYIGQDDLSSLIFPLWPTVRMLQVTMYFWAKQNFFFHVSSLAHCADAASLYIYRTRWSFFSPHLSVTSLSTDLKIKGWLNFVIFIYSYVTWGLKKLSINIFLYSNQYLKKKNCIKICMYWLQLHQQNKWSTFE